MKVGLKRVPVLIGKNGETKTKIENEIGVKIDLNSKTGNCEIRPDIKHPNYDPLSVLVAQKVINAISRGFNPNKALKLLNENYDLEVFNLVSILGKSEKKLKRIKGRIIGRNGEMRKAIEKYANSFLSVYGKTVSIIAEYEELQIGRKAINMIMKGMPHHVVLKFLEDKYQEKKKEQFRAIYKPEF